VSQSSLQRVLFVCFGNACRSQMAEAFARKYGSDVMVPASAGIAPAMAIPPDTIRAMAEREIDLRDQFPKALRHLVRVPFDLLINMSGYELTSPHDSIPMRIWDVPDPVTLNYEQHCKIRDKIENLVMDLVLEFRRNEKRKAQPTT
jgi:arsenate reductase (thioredoxin)